MAASKITDHDFVPVPGSRVCGHGSPRLTGRHYVPLIGMGVEMVRCNAPRHKHTQSEQ